MFDYCRQSLLTLTAISLKRTELLQFSSDKVKFQQIAA